MMGAGVPGRLWSWGSLWDEARTRLWPLPLLAVLSAVALGVGLPRLDAALDDRLPSALTAYLFGGGAGAARTILTAIATSLITVTSLTFSLTVVTLQLASSQYSPRLLRTFTRDRFVHGTLALFLGSFVYALTVLRTVRTADSGGPAFVPQLAVTVAFVLMVASVLGLVMFLAHLAREIRVETILATVHAEATDTIARVLGGSRVRDGSRGGPPPAFSDDNAYRIFSTSSGVLQSVDAPSLLEAAVTANILLSIDVPVGEALVEGSPIGRVWSSPRPAA